MDSRFLMFTGCLMVSIEEFGSLIWFHDSLVIYDGGPLSWDTDQRGSCNNSDTFRVFLQRLQVQVVIWKIDDRWMHYSDYLAPAGQICVVPGQCAFDYMDWFFLISHLFMTPAQPADPPWHPLVTQDDTYVEPHIPEVPVAPSAALAHAPSDVEQPRHAVVSNTIWVVVSNVI